MQFLNIAYASDSKCSLGHEEHKRVQNLVEKGENDILVVIQGDKTDFYPYKHIPYIIKRYRDIMHKEDPDLYALYFMVFHGYRPKDLIPPNYFI